MCWVFQTDEPAVQSQAELDWIRGLPPPVEAKSAEGEEGAEGAGGEEDDGLGDEPVDINQLVSARRVVVLGG